MFHPLIIRHREDGLVGELETRGILVHPGLRQLPILQGGDSRKRADEPLVRSRSRVLVHQDSQDLNNHPFQEHRTPSTPCVMLDGSRKRCLSHVIDQLILQ